MSANKAYDKLQKEWAKRRARMKTMHLLGYKLKDIAAKYHITSARAHQILFPNGNGKRRK